MEVSFSGTREIQVHDLTNDIRINDPHPVDCGGFADIYRGEWIQNALGPEDGVEEKRMQVCLLCFRIPSFHLILVRLQLSFSGYSQGVMHIPDGPEK